MMLSIPGPQGYDPDPGWGANMAAGCKTRKCIALLQDAARMTSPSPHASMRRGLQ
jgi:hypothetical protein